MYGFEYIKNATVMNYYRLIYNLKNSMEIINKYICSCLIREKDYQEGYILISKNRYYTEEELEPEDIWGDVSEFF